MIYDNNHYQQSLSIGVDSDCW